MTVTCTSALYQIVFLGKIIKNFQLVTIILWVFLLPSFCDFFLCGPPCKGKVYIDDDLRFLTRPNTRNKLYNKISGTRKSIQNTPFQQHTIFSNTEMLWVVFFFFFCIYYYYGTYFFSIEKFVFILFNNINDILRVKNVILY